MEKKNAKKVLLGGILIILGVVFALDNFNVLKFSLFFDGWWTIFIIAPCAVGLFTEKEKLGNIIGVIIGVILLLCSQDILSFDIIGKLFFPALVLGFGIKLLCRGLFKDSSNGETIKKLKEKELHSATAVFSGADFRPNGETFHGAEILAVFGGVECDLRDSIIEEDCVISATAIFGGIDIILPDNVNLKTSSSALFGGVSDKKHKNKEENTVTIYVEGAAMFGGVEIK